MRKRRAFRFKLSRAFMSTVQLPFDALLEATEQLEPAQLETLVRRATEIQLQQREEERLMAIWNQPALSEQNLARAQELRRLSEDETISDAERQEMIRLHDQGLVAQTRRLQAVADLARLRGVEPRQLLDEMMPTSP